MTIFETIANEILHNLFPKFPLVDDFLMLERR